jgi:UDP-N-acetylmuramate dehydrogenase
LKNLKYFADNYTMNLQQNISLKPYNTFGIDVAAEHFVELTDINALAELTAQPYEKHILGGGSNILLTQPIKGLVVHNRLKGITVEKEDDKHVWLRVQAGELWHDVVLYAINKGLGGIENLALIPGTAGASPMQNIGAYGVEVKDTITEVSFWHWGEKAFGTFNNSECSFGYRDSIFKHGLKGQTFITSVVYKLSKQHTYNVSYGAIEQELQSMGVEELSVKAIAYAVMNIRTSKLPDPKVIGNAGSFFKNPTISLSHFEKLRAQHEHVPSYPVSNTSVKVPAGWLIEQCGWKGYRKDDMGVHAKQALVLVNYGNAKGAEIWKLSGEIVASVAERFGIELEREVQVW